MIPEKSGDKSLRNHVYGEKYSIGYLHIPHGRACTILDAFYIGADDDGRRIFARQFPDKVIRIYAIRGSRAARCIGGTEPAPDDYHDYHELSIAEEDYLRAVLDRMEKADKTPLSD